MYKVDSFKALLFDMNGTFMFDHDRFGPEEDFFSTYVTLGGFRLSGAEVARAARLTLTNAEKLYSDPRHFDCFPTLLEAVEHFSGLKSRDAQDIANVLAQHELGRVPRATAEVLQRLSQTHALAVVSNIWGPEALWHTEFERASIEHTFSAAIFSSSIGAIKPSPRPFQLACEALSVEPGDCLFVGDSIDRDIAPARKLGMSTALVSCSERDDRGWVIQSVRDLL